jgi:hypothetical protein
LSLANGDPLPYGDGIASDDYLIGFISELGVVNCPGCRYDPYADGDVDVAGLLRFRKDFVITPNR